MELPERTSISSLPAEVIVTISSYLTEDEKQSACIALEAFFRCTTSIVYHVDAISSTRQGRKRKRSTKTEHFFNTYRQRAWGLIQNPQSAARLRGLTLLSPFDYSDLSVDLPLSQFCDERKFRCTGLVEKDSHVDHLLGIVAKNAPGLRYFETNLSRSLEPLLKALIHLLELKIPSTTSLQGVSLPFLRKLTIIHTSMTDYPVNLPSIPSLTSLEIQLRYFTRPRPLPKFVNLGGLPELRDLSLTGTHIMGTLGLVSNPDPEMFCGKSSSLRRVSVRGPFCFDNFTDLPNWLDRLSHSRQLRGLCLDGIKFQHGPDVWIQDPDHWPSLPQLRYLELREVDLAYFEAMPCSGLRKLFVTSKHGPMESDGELTTLIEKASATLEAVSIVADNVPRRKKVNAYHVFSADFVNTLTRCLRLRHFESVGSYFFRSEDWQFLCARSFLHFDQVHVEAQHPKFYDRPDNLDILCREYKVDRVQPATLQELYDGRMYVSPKLSSKWVQKPDVSTKTIKKEAELDRAHYVTRFLSQRFQRAADVEGDLSDVYEAGLILSPRLQESAWCEYPAFVCKQLRCLPADWAPVHELML